LTKGLFGYAGHQTMEFVLIFCVGLFIVDWLFYRAKKSGIEASSTPRAEFQGVKEPNPIATAEKPRQSGCLPKNLDIENLPRVEVKHVVDGDTVYVCKNGQNIKVRLDSIDCPEDGQPWGESATGGLIKIIGGQHIRIEEHGLDRYGRTLATLFARNKKNNEWMNVNERMVTLGHAWVMRKYYDHLPADRQNKLNQLESWSKSKRVGLWGTENPTPPWLWRRDIRDAVPF
jgi:micrococcal nuclease